MSTRLHVGSIPSAVLEEDLKATFAKFGPVDAVEIVRDSATGMSKGFATVAMARDEDAATAIGRLNFTHMPVVRSASVDHGETDFYRMPFA